MDWSEKEKRGIQIYQVFAKTWINLRRMRCGYRIDSPWNTSIYIYSFIIHLIQFPGEGAIRAELWIKVKRRAWIDVQPSVFLNVWVGGIIYCFLYYGYHWHACLSRLTTLANQAFFFQLECSRRVAHFYGFHFPIALTLFL